MKVHVYEDETWRVCYDRPKERPWQKPIDVPRRLIREYDAALKAFEEAAKKLEDFAAPIYEERRKLDQAKAAKRMPMFEGPKYTVPDDLAARIDKALFHG